MGAPRLVTTRAIPSRRTTVVHVVGTWGCSFVPVPADTPAARRHADWLGCALRLADLASIRPGHPSPRIYIRTAPGPATLRHAALLSALDDDCFGFQGSIRLCREHQDHPGAPGLVHIFPAFSHRLKRKPGISDNTQKCGRRHFLAHSPRPTLSSSQRPWRSPHFTSWGPSSRSLLPPAS